jgi:hypothetical protein
MPCTFLSSDHLLTCRALWKVYVPSAFELDEFCRHERHTMCLLYCRSKTEGMFIFIDESVRKQSGTSSSHGSEKKTNTRKKTGGGMSCPFLEEKDSVICKADEEAYVPSINELNAFCRNGSFERCLFYCAEELDVRLDYSGPA